MIRSAYLKDTIDVLSDLCTFELLLLLLKQHKKNWIIIFLPESSRGLQRVRWNIAEPGYSGNKKR